LELSLELEPLEPMFGHGVEPDFEVPDFWACAVPVVGGVVELDVVAAGVVAVLDDDAASAIPAAAPPVASAPATIVAPSILEIVMGSNLLCRLLGCEVMVSRPAKSQGVCFVGIA
jgi:hypothetical protein